MRAQTALPILEKLDPYNFFITYKLFRESTKSVGGSIKKVSYYWYDILVNVYLTTLLQDLTYLNRDLSKVILIDTDPEHVSLQPENSIILPKWKGDAHDKGLVALIPFLECTSFEDVSFPASIVDTECSNSYCHLQASGRPTNLDRISR